MKLTIHRGAEEIGGNCLEFCTDNSRIILDYGIPLSEIKDGAKLSKTNNSRFLLNIPGLYETWYKSIDGIIISHCHMDHYGMLFEKPVYKSIPVYMSKLMESLARVTGKLGPLHRDLQATTKHYYKEIPFQIGDFKITPFLMDNSAVESFAFLIEAEDKRVIYFGDYRTNEYKRNAFKKFANMNFGKIDLLITEGTLIGTNRHESQKTEHDIFNEIKHIAQKTNGPLFVQCSSQNIDLLASLGGVADISNKYFLVDAYTAFILELVKCRGKQLGIGLEVPSTEKDYLKIIDWENGKRELAESLKYDTELNRLNRNTVTWEWIKANYRNCIIPVTPDLRWIKRIINDYTGGVFIYSMWDGYLRDPYFRQTKDYFKHKGLRYMHVHVSGHVYEQNLKQLVSAVNPELIVPIHTQYKFRFKELFGHRACNLHNKEELII